MRKQHLTNAINTILETNEEVTIRVKYNSYLFLERAGQLVFDALHKDGYKICTYDGQVQVLEELGADLPKEPKKYTLKDFNTGVVGIEYKGDLEKLQNIKGGECNGSFKYYWVAGTKFKCDDHKPSYIKVWVSENDIEL